MNKGGFSWERLVGVTRAKQRIARKTGIPFTKSGRERKVGRIVTGGGCSISIVMFGIVLAVVVSLAG